MPKADSSENAGSSPPISLPEPKAETKLVAADSAGASAGEWIVLTNRRGSEPKTTETPRAEHVDKPILDRKNPKPRPTSGEPEGTVEHVVKRGENFWSISRDYYGTGRFYKALWRANRDKFAKPESLFVGATIRVPLPEALDPDWIIEPPATRSAAKRSSSSSRVREASSRSLENDSSENDARALPSTARPAHRRAWSDLDDGYRLDRPVHRVRPGENLRTIARDFLGDPRRADEIVELNPGQTLDAPRVDSGILLILPDDARGRRPAAFRESSPR